MCQFPVRYEDFKHFSESENSGRPPAHPSLWPGSISQTAKQFKMLVKVSQTGTVGRKPVGADGSQPPGVAASAVELSAVGCYRASSGKGHEPCSMRSQPLDWHLQDMVLELKCNKKPTAANRCRPLLVPKPGVVTRSPQKHPHLKLHPSGDKY